MVSIRQFPWIRVLKYLRSVYNLEYSLRGRRRKEKDEGCKRVRNVIIPRSSLFELLFCALFLRSYSEPSFDSPFSRFHYKPSFHALLSHSHFTRNFCALLSVRKKNPWWKGSPRFHFTFRAPFTRALYTLSSHVYLSRFEHVRLHYMPGKYF